MEKPSEKKWDGDVFRHNFTVHACAFYFLLAFEPLPEEKMPDKHNQVCAEDHQNDVKETLNDANQPDQPLEQATEDKRCPLKPRVLKFKKIKDGKLSFTGSKNYTKLHQKESKCVHVSPLKFVGNDPDTESQTLRGYLDEECEPAFVKAEPVDNCSAVGCSGYDSRRMERGFLTSLQEADIECVAIVCKKSSNMMKNRCQVAGDSACESVKQEVKDGIDDRRKIGQGSKEDMDLNAIKVDISDTPGKTVENASPIVLADSSCKREGEQEQTSPLKSYSAKSRYPKESDNQMETDCINEVENFDPICRRSEESLGRTSYTEAVVLNQIEFVDENSGDLKPVSVFNNVSGGSGSQDSEFAHAQGIANTDKNDNFPNSKSANDGSEQNHCNMHSLEENVGNRTDDNSSHETKCLLQKDTGKENVSSKIDSGEVKTSATSGCIDDDSSDDFQVSSIRNSQAAPPSCIAQKSSKTKQRKGTKKCKNKTATRQVRNHNNSQKLPAEWPCSACTFINDGQLLECSICLTPRVAMEESLSTPNRTDLGSEILNGQSIDDVEMVQVAGVSKVRVHYQNIKSASNKCGKDFEVAKHDMILEAINDGSGLLETGGDVGKSVVLPHSTPVRDLLVDSKEASTDASRARHNSTATCMEQAMAVDDSDKRQIAEPGLPPWSCSACTFLNLSQMIECSICLTPRRRSQRLGASKTIHTGGRQEKDCLKKNRASARRRWERNRVKKDKNGQEMDVDVVNCSVTDIEECRSVDIETHCDQNSSVADAEGLTPEPTESFHDTDSRQGDAGLEEDSTQDDSGVIKSKPRKRLKLEEVRAAGDMSDEIGDFSDDLDGLCENTSLTMHSLVSSSSDQKETKTCIPFVDKDATSSEDCFLSTDDDKLERKPRQKTDTSLIGKTSFEVCSDELDVSACSVGATGSSGENLAITSAEVAISNNSLSCQQSAGKVVENLEELKAAAEELFMSEWEDDDSWWEGDSCSGQSSLPSSSETVSSSQAVTSPVFTKCSDLYSVTELKQKLQTTPGQSKTCTTAAVDNVQRFELGNQMSSSPVIQSTCSFAPDTAVVSEEEDEADEPDYVPEAMKLRFCLSLYTERVYLYNEVNHLVTL